MKIIFRETDILNYEKLIKTNKHIFEKTSTKHPKKTRSVETAVMK